MVCVSLLTVYMNLLFLCNETVFVYCIALCYTMVLNVIVLFC